MFEGVCSEVYMFLSNKDYSYDYVT